MKRIKKRFLDENGLVIVEATIVFPVMFFVLFFIIFIGNAYFEQAKVDEIVLRHAIFGAECVADPFLYEMESSHTVPTDVKAINLEPYRYIFGKTSSGSITALEDNISKSVQKEINDSGLIFFSNSRANVLGTDENKIASFNNHFLYSTFVVQVNYEVKFPIRFIGENRPTIIKYSSRAEVSVDDTAEFIRNVDMVVDLLDGTKLAESISGLFGKVNDFIGKFGGK